VSGFAEIEGLQIGPACVRSSDWIKTPAGNEVVYVWSADVRMVTDAGVPVKGFRSTERWLLLFFGTNGEPALILPGCKVQSIVKCPKAPPHNVWGVE
jgi:hypothetical protein